MNRRGGILTNEEMGKLLQVLWGYGDDLTTEEVVKLVKDDHRLIAQAQLSKLQQARPTTEQAREKVWHILKNDECKECLKSAYLYNNDSECQKCKRDQLVRLLPDEQAIEKRTRQEIGAWLEKNWLSIHQKYVDKYPEANRITLLIYVLDDIVSTLKSGQMPEDK